MLLSALSAEVFISLCFLMEPAFVLMVTSSKMECAAKSVVMEGSSLSPVMTEIPSMAMVVHLHAQSRAIIVALMGQLHPHPGAYILANFSHFRYRRLLDQE
jgi:hypothetical protein